MNFAYLKNPYVYLLHQTRCYSNIHKDSLNSQKRKITSKSD